jgi:hypothetical protein
MGLFRNFLSRLLGTASTAAAITAEPKPRPAMRVSAVAAAEAGAAYGRPLNPWELPAAPSWFEGGKGAQMALDGASGPGIADLYAWAVQGAFSEGLGFLGYPYLAELSQRPEYRRVSEIWAAEATRKWVDFKGDPERIKEIEKAIEKFKLRDRFRQLAEKDGFFGRAQLFIDLGHSPNSPELKKPLIAKAKVRKGAIKNFKIIEPFWSYPGMYQSDNPLASDFYKPKYWYVMASEVHSSRLLTITGREMPDMLKPAYSFGGLSLSQMAKPYVDNWLRTRQSISDLLHSFSTMVLATDMSTILSGGVASGLLERLDLFNRTRDNRGVMALNKETEELTNVSTPLGTLDALQSQAQEQIASVTGIPLVILLGVTPSGLNASSDGEIRTFYATIKAYQERVFRDALAKVVELLQYHLFGDVDPEITFEFVDLWEAPEQDKAAIRKSDADVDVAYVGAGIVSNEEVRKRIIQDQDSPYFGMDLDPEDVPEPPEQEEDPFAEGGDEPDPEDPPGGKDPKQAQDAGGDWKEDKHPRRKDGKFGSGGGGASAKSKPDAPEAKAEPEPAAKPAVKPPHPKVAAILGDKGVDHLRELIADKNSKSADILAALKPLDDAQREMTPTLPHDKEPDAAFWSSRTYADGMDARQARDHLAKVAASYADKDGGVGVKRDKKARFLLGPPAAGKSTGAEQIARTEGYAIVDGDDAKKVIPEFDEGVGASAVHNESSHMSNAVLQEMVGRGDNIILPLVGGSPGSIEKRIAVLKAAGYSVTVDVVDVHEDEAARRMASRALSSGRHISSSYFASIGDGPLRTYEHLKSTHDDVGFGRINGNGGPRDENYTEAINHPTAETGYRLFGNKG